MAQMVQELLYRNQALLCLGRIRTNREITGELRHGGEAKGAGTEGRGRGRERRGKGAEKRRVPGGEERREERTRGRGAS